MKFWLLLFLLCAACLPFDGDREQAMTPLSPAPDFSLPTLDGGTIRLYNLRGEWVILNFWATWCQPCVTEIPALQTVATRHQIPVLYINMRESAQTIRAFLDDQEAGMTVLINPDDATLMNYQVLSLPQTLLIGPDGTIAWRQFGPIDAEGFENELREQLSR
jgi:peroxiredoxin